MIVLLEKILHWSKDSVKLNNDELIFQFCYFDNCNIVEIDVQKVKFIGCLFDGGYIADSTIKVIEFIGCSIKNANNPLDLSLADIEHINDVYSNIEYIDMFSKHRRTIARKQLINISCLIEENVHNANDFLEEFEFFIISSKLYDHLAMIGFGVLNIYYSIRLQTIKLLLKYYTFLSSDYQDWIMEAILSQIGNAEVFPNYKEVIDGLQPDNYLFKASFDRVNSQNANSIIDSLTSAKAALLYKNELKTLIDINKITLLKNHYNKEISKLSNDILGLVNG